MHCLPVHGQSLHAAAGRRKAADIPLPILTGNTDFLQQFFSILSAAQFYVFFGSEIVDQIVVLKYQRNMMPAVIIQALFANVFSVVKDASGYRGV